VQSEAELGATWHDDLDAMLRAINLLTIHTARDANSENLIDARRIAPLRRHVYLINASRGGIVDEEGVRPDGHGDVRPARPDGCSEERAGRPVRPDGRSEAYALSVTARRSSLGKCVPSYGSMAVAR